MSILTTTPVRPGTRTEFLSTADEPRFLPEWSKASGTAELAPSTYRELSSAAEEFLAEHGCDVFGNVIDEEPTDERHHSYGESSYVTPSGTVLTHAEALWLANAEHTELSDAVDHATWDLWTATVDALAHDWIEDRSEYLSGSARGRNTRTAPWSNRRCVAAERPWTDLRDLGARYIVNVRQWNSAYVAYETLPVWMDRYSATDGYRFAGTTTVVLADGTMYTALAPNSAGTGFAGSYRATAKRTAPTAIGKADGRTSEEAAKRGKALSNAERQARYRARRKAEAEAKRQAEYIEQLSNADKANGKRAVAARTL